MVTAELKNYRQAPRKVRLVADTVRGKKVTDALDTLTFVNKRASDPVKKLIESAVANATHNHSLAVEDLYITEIRVDDGVTLHRYRPRARGRSAPIRKRTSRVTVILDIKGGSKKKEAKNKDEKVEKEAVAKKAPVKKAPAKKLESKKVVTKDKK